MPQIIPARRDYVGESLREFNESGAPARFGKAFGFNKADNERKAKELREEEAIDKYLGPTSKGLSREFKKIQFENLQKQNAKADELKQSAAQVRQIERQFGKAEGSLSAYDDDPAMAFQVAKAMPEDVDRAQQDLFGEQQSPQQGPYQNEGLTELKEPAQTKDLTTIPEEKLAQIKAKYPKYGADLEKKINAQKERKANKTMLDDRAQRNNLPPGSYDAYIDNPSMAPPLEKPAKPEKPAPLSQFEKTVQTEAAKKYIAALEERPKIKSTLADIQHARDLSQELRGVTGSIKANLGLGKSAELDALGLRLIEPVIKVFNPVGAIPVAKINLIKDVFAIKATDPQWKIDAKADALERFSKQALARNEELINLYQQYDGNPPPEEVNRHNEESETLADAMIDYGNEHIEKETKVQKEESKGGQIKVSDGKSSYMIDAKDLKNAEADGFKEVKKS